MTALGLAPSSPHVKGPSVRVRVVAVAGLVAVLAAGCGGGAEVGAPEGATTPSTATVGAQEPSTGTSEPDASRSPTPDASPPEPASDPKLAWMDEDPPSVDLRLRDGDYGRIVDEVLRYHGWLFAHPHRIDARRRVFNEACRCYDPLGARMQRYSDHGRRVLSRYVVHSVELQERAEFSFRLRVRWQLEGRVVDAAGEVVDRGRTPILDETWFFMSGNSGSYRLAGQRPA